MSNLEEDPQETALGSVAVAESAHEVLAGREVALGRYTVVRRFLPQTGRRTVGAWCFLDHFGPEDVSSGTGMRVPPHPHTGLQTVTWLLDGEVLHRDSLGSEQAVRPGELNLMTAARGIAHSEESPSPRPSLLHGVQLWVALPEGARHSDPAFDHVVSLPVLGLPGAGVTVLMGSVDGVRSPAPAHTPLVGADVAVTAGADVRLPLERAYEHAVLVLAGSVAVDGRPLGVDTMVYLGRDRAVLPLRGGADGARMLLLGGEPFDEQLVMWWNFVGRSHEEIVAFREDWADGRRFGEVHGFAGDPLPAPPMPTTRLRPRGRAG